MDNKKNGIPKLRFPGFTGAWEQRKLGDLGKAKSGFGFPESEQGGKEGVPFFKVSDMNLKGNEFEMTTATNYVTHEQISLKKWKPIEEVPAIFFAKVGAAVLLNRKRLCRLPFLLDNNTMAFSFDVQKLDIDFTVSLFSKINLPALAQVGALPSYNTKDVESIKVYIPSLEEQKKIGVYLKKINNLIALHQRKLEHLQEQKKGLLQKMFPKNGETVPEVRFPGFTDAWEQRKFDEIFKSISDKGYPELPVISASQELGMVFRDSSGYDIKHNKKSEVGYKRVQSGDFVIHLRSFQGGFAASEIEGITSPAYTIIRFKVNNQDFYFWKYVFTSKKFIDSLVKVTYGIRDGRSISYTDFKNLKWLIPSKKEQQQIGAWFEKFDSLIALHQRKLEHLELMKKGLLQQMFV